MTAFMTRGSLKNLGPKTIGPHISLIPRNLRTSIDDNFLRRELDRMISLVGNDILLKATVSGDLLLAQETALTKILNDEFVRRSKTLLGPDFSIFAPLLDPDNWATEGGVHTVTPSVLRTFNEQASATLGPAFADAVASDVNSYIEAIYKSARTTLRQRLRLPRVDLSLTDTTAIEALEDKMHFWIGTSYDRVLSDKISDTVGTAINAGLGTEETAALLKESLGTKFAASDRYWNIVAGSALEKTRTSSHLKTMSQAHITEYEIVAIIDDRTSEICRMMDGTVFQVLEGERVLNEYLSSDSPEGSKSAWPWGRFDESRARNGEDALFTEDPASGERDYLEDSLFELAESGIWEPSGDGTPSRVLAQSNLVLPPYHANCRTTFIATEKALAEAR